MSDCKRMTNYFSASKSERQKVSIFFDWDCLTVLQVPCLLQLSYSVHTKQTPAKLGNEADGVTDGMADASKTYQNLGCNDLSMGIQDMKWSLPIRVTLRYYWPLIDLTYGYTITNVICVRGTCATHPISHTMVFANLVCSSKPENASLRAKPTYPAENVSFSIRLPLSVQGCRIQDAGGRRQEAMGQGTSFGGYVNPPFEFLYTLHAQSTTAAFQPCVVDGKSIMAKVTSQSPHAAIHSGPRHHHGRQYEPGSQPRPSLLACRC